VLLKTAWNQASFGGAGKCVARVADATQSATTVLSLAMPEVIEQDSRGSNYRLAPPIAST
jgi:hypothetical protein